MVQEWVKNIAEQAMGGAPFSIGDTVPHPDGFDVIITDGKYWGSRGLSNHWSYRKVDFDGQAVGETMSGYGWDPVAVQRARDDAGFVPHNPHLDTTHFIENNTIPDMEGNNLSGEFDALAKFHRRHPEDWATSAIVAGWKRTVDDAGVPCFVNEHGGQPDYSQDWRELGELQGYEPVLMDASHTGRHLVSDLMAEFLMTKGSPIVRISQNNNAWFDSTDVKNLLEHPLLLEAKATIHTPYMEAKAAAKAAKEAALEAEAEPEIEAPAPGM